MKQKKKKAKPVNTKAAIKAPKKKIKKPEVKAKVVKVPVKVPVKKAPIDTYKDNRSDNVVFERKERSYVFDSRLVPFYMGSDSKDGNLILREALIALGKTKEMTDLFSAIKTSGLAYNEDGKKVFMKALYIIINGFDEIALSHIFEEDIQTIYEHNLKVFNDFWEDIERKKDDPEFKGFSN